MPEVTVYGLVDQPAASITNLTAQWAVAAGTADAITGAYPNPNTSLPDGLILGFRASAANGSTTPTFSPDNLPAHTITKLGGSALVGGDIPGNLAECLVRYNLTNTRWELLNPAGGSLNSAGWAADVGVADAVAGTYAPAVILLTDGLLLGIRAAFANATTTPTFSPNSLAAHTITRLGGQALVPNDIQANAEYFVRYNLANTRWELLNPSAQSIPWVVAGGTADVITATYTPAVSALWSGLLVSFRAGATNATTTPTFSPNGLTAHTITKTGGTALIAGDISGGGEYLVRYSVGNSRWELLNPTGTQVMPWGVGAGTAQAQTLTLPTVATLYDGLTIGMRAGVANTAAAPTLAINSGTALTIVKRAATALVAGDIALGAEYTLRYNLANTRWVLLNPVVN